VFPFTALFTMRNRPRTEPDRSVLDEEYEWVFGKKPGPSSHDQERQRTSRAEGPRLP